MAQNKLLKSFRCASNLHIYSEFLCLFKARFEKNKPGVIRGNYGRVHHNIWLTCWTRLPVRPQMQTCRGFVWPDGKFQERGNRAQYFPTKSLNWCCNSCNTNIYLDVIQRDFTARCENRGSKVGHKDITSFACAFLLGFYDALLNAKDNRRCFKSINYKVRYVKLPQLLAKGLNPVESSWAEPVSRRQVTNFNTLIANTSLSGK